MSVAAPRVLVVDDEPSSACATAMGLRIEGFDVETAADAVAALGLMSTATFDVAVVDLMMPVTNGIQLARLIRDKNPHARVVLMGAYYLSEPQLLRTDCGAVGFIPKPFNPADLARLLRSKLGGAAPFE